MIAWLPYLWLSLGAYAADLPSRLDAEVPAARALLETCASDLCARSPAARAAFLVAVHTYVATNVADGVLAATLRELDGDLFTQLPDVVVDAATTAPDWVTDRVVDEPAIVLAAREGTLRAGYYRSLDELRDNAPGVAWTDPTLKESDVTVSEGRLVVHHQLSRKDVRELGRDKILGFSDGTDVYVTYGGRPRRAGAEFHRVTLAGTVGVYEMGGDISLSVGGVPLFVPFREVRVLDLGDGSGRLMERSSRCARSCRLAPPCSRRSKPKTTSEPRCSTTR